LQPFFAGDFQVPSGLVLPIVEELRPLLQDLPRASLSNFPDY
jgi:hypothetical protein